MPILKRFNELQGLADVDVLFEEEGLNSNFFNITEFPDPLQVGKNSFLIAGSAKLLDFTELKIDIVDSEGNSIYHEPVRDYLEGNMRRISIEVYDQNSPGSGYLYIVGEAHPERNEVPPVWQGVYNVRYVRPISINTTQQNTQPIFFYKQPRIRGQEITKAFIEELPASASYSLSGSVTVTAKRPGSETSFEGINDDDDLNPAVVTAGPDQVGKFLKTYKNKRENKWSVGAQPTVLALGNIQRRASPEPASHTITINSVESSPENQTDKITSAFVGGKITIKSAQVDESTFPIGGNQFIKTQSIYSSRIQEVINSTTFIPESPFTLEVHPSKQTGEKEGYLDPDFDSNRVWANVTPQGKILDEFLPSNANPKQPDTSHTDETGAVWIWSTVTDASRIPKEEDAGGDATIDYYGWSASGSLSQDQLDNAVTKYNVSMVSNSNVTMSILPTPGKTLSGTYLRSYADFSVVNMRTFSGDIFRVKVYGKLRGGLTDFELLYDSPIESPQVLIDPFSVDGFTNVGYFYTQSIIDSYWASSSNSTVTQNDDYMVDGVLISGSNSGLGEICEFFTTSSYELERNVRYSLGFDAYYVKQDKLFSSDDGTTVTKKAAELKVYLSGSRSKDGTGDLGEDVYLGSVKIPPGPGTLEGKQSGVFQTFTSAAKHFPNAQPKFVATSGQWVIKDIDLKPSVETNFSPDYFRTIIPLPYIHKRPAMMDFLVEFYDLNNNIADSFAFLENFRIIGSPQVIQGDKNLLSGSMYLGNTQGSGIEMHGGSAYMRSVGYEGFEATISSGSGGFMMWSGSLSGSRSDGSPVLHTTESYEGVGLEIVDAHGATDRYLQFRTNPSTFKVQTDEFFLGSSLQYVSGSNSKIEISSSNFHLTPEGNVTMSGTIAATAGNIGDFKIIDGKISGSNITMDATNSTIYKTDAGPGTDSSAAFDQLRDEYYLDFTPETESPDNYFIKMGPNFMVDKDGILIASGAVFEGRITASSGLIGGFHIGSASLFAGSSEHVPNFFISGSATGNAGGVGGKRSMFISASKFQVTAEGDITGSQVLFTGGKIGGFTISSTEISASGLLLKSSGQITASNALLTGGLIDASPYWKIDRATDTSAGGFISSSRFKVSAGGVVTGSEVLFTGGKIAAFTITDDVLSNGNNFFISGSASANEYFISASRLNVKASGDITGSNVLFTGGKIAGWVVDDNTVYNLTSTKYSGLSSTGPVRIFAGASNLTAGTGSAVFNVKSDGVVTASAGLIGGWAINPSPVEIRSPNERIVLSAVASAERITVKDTDDDAVIKIGEISSDTSDKYGIKIFDGSGATDDNIGTGTVVMLGDLGNKIGGWQITDTQIRTIPDAGFGGQYDLAGGEDGLILSNDGRIHSAAYVPNQKGWNIDTVTNGFAEFQNVVVRGTLKTAVFQKDSVNVVGGTLRIANAAKLTPLRSGSTVLSGSTSMSANQVTMSVDNVSGFEAGEILLAKKIGNTGFQTEYLYVTGSQRWSELDPNITGSSVSNDTDGISGELYVGRAYGQLTGGDVSGSSTITLSSGTFSSTTVVGNYSQSIFNVDDASGISKQDFLKIEHPSSGNFEFVKVTSISSNTLTVRRKAWFPLDTNLGATEVIGGWPDNSKIWLVNDRMFTAQLHNVVSAGQTYEEGQVFASTGKFTKWISSGWIDLDANPTSPYTPMIQIMERTGSGVYDYVLRTQLGDLSGLSSAYLYGDENPGFGIYTENGYFSGAITAQTGSFAGIVHVATTQGGLETGQKISIGTDVSGTNDGIYINNNNYWFTSAEFRLGDGNNYLWISGSQASPASSFKIKTEDLSINTTKFIVSSSLNSGTIKMGGVSSTWASGVTSTTNTGVYMDGTGLFRVGESTNGDNFIYFDGSTIQMKSTDFDLTSTNLAINNTSMYLGTIVNNADSSGKGLFVSSSGAFRLFGDSNNYLTVDGGNLVLKSEELHIAASTFDVNTAGGGSLALGSTLNANISGTNKGLYMSGSGDFLLYGSAQNYLKFDSAAASLDILSDSFALSSSTLSVDSTGDGGTGVIRLGASGGPSSATANTAGIYMDGGGALNVYGDAANYLRFDGSTVDIKSDELTINTTGTNKLKLLADGANTPTFAMGATLNTSVSGTNKGVYMDGQGDFLLYGSATNYFKFDASAASIDIKSDSFDLDASTLIMKSAGTGSIALGASPPSHAASGNGFFVDGSGRTLIGNTSGNYMKWDGTTLEIAGDITISNPADQGFTKTFRQDGTPTAIAAGDQWYDTNDNNKLYIATAAGTGDWAATIDGTIATAQSDATTAQNTANSKNVIFRTGSTPTALTIGDLWYHTGEGNKLYVATATGTGNWNATVDGTIATAQALAESKNTVFRQDAVPTSGVISGDIWYDTNDGNKLYVALADGSDAITSGEWTVTVDTTIATAQNAATTAQTAIDAMESQVKLTPTGMDIETTGQSPSNFTLATFGATTSFFDGTASENVKLQLQAAGVTAYGDDASTKSTMTSAGMTIFNDGTVADPGTGVAHFGTTARIGPISTTTTRLQLATGSFAFIARDGSGADTYTLEMKPDGTIEGPEYIIEKTRLFGFGKDGTVTLTASDCTISNGGNGVGTKVSDAQIKDANGTVVCDRSSSTWIMKSDWYCYDLTLTGSMRLVTYGFRLFVFGKLTIGGSAIISHNGSGGGNGSGATAGAAGAGAGEGTLKAGSAGGAGGAGGSGNGAGGSGGGGGGAGGNAGIVFISARKIVNSGNITATGGSGGTGAHGGTE